jgi:hypothetical protein
MTVPKRVLTAIVWSLLAAPPVWAQQGPPPSAANLPAEILRLACAPAVAHERPAMSLRITGSQDSTVRIAHAEGDLLTINAGTSAGIQVGQEFYVRRLEVSRREPIGRETPASVRTAGWVRVWAVDTDMSLVSVVHACDTINLGDYLEPFVLPPVTRPVPDAGAVDRDNYGRVMAGADRRRSFGKGDFIIVDRGSDHGVYAGAQFVLYRDKRQPGHFLFIVGEALAIDVRPDSATLQVTASRDAIVEGDYAAMRR